MHCRHWIVVCAAALILSMSPGAQTPAASMQATESPHSGAMSQEAYEAILQFYEYDTDMPLEARVLEREEHPTYIREKIVFNGVRDSRVPGYLGLDALGCYRLS